MGQLTPPLISTSQVNLFYQIAMTECIVDSFVLISASPCIFVKLVSSTPQEVCFEAQTADRAFIVLHSRSHLSSLVFFDLVILMVWIL
jgi:hypothetical protein